MNKLLSLMVAAIFTAVSGSALAAAHAGAQDKKGEKMEKKAEKTEKKEKKAKAEKKKKADKMEKKSDKK
jgi:Ni/Co efflux regulator RcnB